MGIRSIALLICVLVGTAATALAQAPALEVRVENKLPIARASETVALSWAVVARELPGVAPARVRVSERISEKELTTQALDANADGQPDSLLFQIDLAAGEVRAFVISAAAPATKPVARVHAKFVPEREDVAWESDRIAFRAYGKKLWELENLHTNGIDVWPKRTRNLVLDAWYAKGHDGYHVDTGEGADFYQVGPTLGTGGTAIWQDSKLYRGDNFLSHRIVADGPVRAIFELEYGPIDAGSRRVVERKRVSIDGGHYFFRQQSTFTGQGPQPLQVAVGLVKRPSMIGSTSKVRDWAWLTGWGPIEPRTRGHGDLGTAVLMEKSQLFDTRELDDHYVAIGNVQQGAPLISYVGAGWTSSRDFESAEDWWREVDSFAQRLGSPLAVVITKNGRIVQP